MPIESGCRLLPRNRSSTTEHLFVYVDGMGRERIEPHALESWRRSLVMSPPSRDRDLILDLISEVNELRDVIARLGSGMIDAAKITREIAPKITPPRQPPK